MRRAWHAFLLIVACAVPGVRAVPASAQLFGGTSANEPASVTDSLPATFRGQISYSGTHEGQLLSQRRATRAYSGRYSLDLEVDGSAVRGRYSGTGGINSGTVSGVRTGNRCRLVDDRWER